MDSDILLEWLEEDVGFDDITTSLLPDKLVKARIFAKEDLYVSGVPQICKFFERCNVRTEPKAKDGDPIHKGQTILTLNGNVKDILTAERTALNLLQRMCGITTTTRRCVDVVEGKVRIAATRKTLLPYYDKIAVVAGGGDPHRWRLDDMFLIKDNHISVLGIKEAVNRAKKSLFTKKIEVEVEDTGQAEVAARAGADIIMLDNMSPEKMSKTIKKVRELGFTDVIFEASGNITPETLPQYAKTGVDIISMGWITHSVRAADISLEITGD